MGGMGASERDFAEWYRAEHPKGAGISKDDADPRVAIDMAEIDVSASPERLTITGPDEVLARLALAPALWAPGYPSFVTAQADVGPPAAGVCPAGAHLSIGVAEPRCYEVDAESISAGIDESLAQSVPSATGGLLVPWAQGGTEDLVREVADACSRPTESGACPTGQVAIRVADGRVGVFTMPPPHPRACRHSCRRCR